MHFSLFKQMNFSVMWLTQGDCSVSGWGWFDALFACLTVHD
jgi:hypothetical protein